MYLKSLILKGFKSFADRSVLSLEPGITAVVGPNGSGKSNISDAVLWVLGERNAKNLRGQAMEDVIFAGSSARKSVGLAEVDLVLDNSDGTLPVDYSEVAITRRMYRSGESEYLINGTAARRMDVLDILHDSGLGTGTHSIISQGNLDSILQSKPEDRRALIEEAAGVLKHKQRKAKSARKLERMDQHLARVKDVAAEVERQLGPLARKAKRARTYQELSAQLADMTVSLAVDDLRTLQRAWDETLEKERALEQELEQRKAAIDAAEQDAERIQEGIRRQSVDAGELSRQHRRASAAVERFDAATLLLHEKRRAAQSYAADLQVTLETDKARRAQAEQDRAAVLDAGELAGEGLERAREQRHADLVLERGAHGCLQALEHELARALDRLERDVAGEAVGHDDVEGAGEDVGALGVAGEAAARGRERLVVGQRHLGALGLLGAVAEQAHARLGHAQHGAGVGAAHLRELHDHVRAHVGVGAHVEKDGRAAGDAGERQRERGALDALEAADAEGRRREDGAGGAGGEEAVRLARAHGGGGADDARVLLGAHGLGRVLGHRDDLGGDQRAGALMGGGERLHELGGAGDEHLEVGVGGERLRHALEKDLGLLVRAHDVYADGGHDSPFVVLSTPHYATQGGPPRPSRPRRPSSPRQARPSRPRRPSSRVCTQLRN